MQICICSEHALLSARPERRKRVIWMKEGHTSTQRKKHSLTAKKKQIFFDYWPTRCGRWKQANKNPLERLPQKKPVKSGHFIATINCPQSVMIISIQKWHPSQPLARNAFLDDQNKTQKNFPFGTALAHSTFIAPLAKLQLRQEITYTQITGQRQITLMIAVALIFAHRAWYFFFLSFRNFVDSKGRLLGAAHSLVRSQIRSINGYNGASDRRFVVRKISECQKQHNQWIKLICADWKPSKPEKRHWVAMRDI